MGSLGSMGATYYKGPLLAKTSAAATESAVQGELMNSAPWRKKCSTGLVRCAEDTNMDTLCQLETEKVGEILP